MRDKHSMELENMAREIQMLERDKADLRAQLAAEKKRGFACSAELEGALEQLAAANKRLEKAEKQEPTAHLHRTNSNSIECFYRGNVLPADGNHITREFVDSLPLNKSVALYTRPIPPADVAELQSKLDKSTALVQEIAGIAFEHILPNETTLGLPHLLRSQFGRIAELERILSAIDKELRGKVNDPDPLPPMYAGSVGHTTTYGLVAGLLRERDKLLSEAREEGRKEAQEWLPIETAPRGSENNFLGWDGETIEKTWEGWDENGKPVYVCSDWVSWEPTHWMPLPESPASLNAKEGGE